MFRYHSMRQREAHAVTLRFSGEEGDEDLLKILGRDSRAGVLD